jgi:hypothetical protein
LVARTRFAVPAVFPRSNWVAIARVPALIGGRRAHQQKDDKRWKETDELTVAGAADDRDRGRAARRRRDDTSL